LSITPIKNSGIRRKVKLKIINGEENYKETFKHQEEGVREEGKDLR